MGRCEVYLVTSDNVCEEGEELDLDCHKVHISLLVEVGACSGEEKEEEEEEEEEKEEGAATTSTCPSFS